MLLALAVLLLIATTGCYNATATSRCSTSIDASLLPIAAGESAGDQRSPALDPGSAVSAFQPGELAKIALAIFFARLSGDRARQPLARRAQVSRHALPRVRDLNPILVIWLAAMAVLVFSADLGMAHTSGCSS
jgi:hypothetical protein